MADPVTMLILTGGSLAAASAIQSGRIAKAQGSFEEKLALRNQESLNRQARAEQAASRIEESRIARRQKIFQARQIARIGKGGAGYGDSTLAALVDTASQFSMERNLALRRGFYRSSALKERGTIMAAQGRWAKTLGTQAQRLSYIKATGSLLAAAGTASYYGGGNTGGIDYESLKNTSGNFFGPSRYDIVGT